MRIIVMGAGPIGGIVGGRLARQGEDVTLADIDAEHVRAIREKGLYVEVPDGPFHVKAPILFPGEIEGKFDLGLIAVRSNYTKDALASVVPRLSPNAILVSLQNGMNPPLLEEAVGPDRAIGAVVRMRSTRPAPGHVRTVKRGRLYIGHLHGRMTEQLQRVHALFDAAIPTEMTDNIYGTLWSKLTYSCLGMFGALGEEPLKTVWSDEANRRLCIDFFGEMTQTATQAGARLEPLAEYHPMDFHPSRSYDARFFAFDRMVEGLGSYEGAETGHQIEPGGTSHVDYTIGHVVKEGDRLGVPTPICRAVARMAHEIEDGKRALRPDNYAELRATIKRP